MPSGSKHIITNGGLRAMKRWGNDLERHREANRKFKEDPQLTEYTEVDLYDDYILGVITDFEVREFIKKLGKTKKGGILTYKVLIHKKFIKYLPKKARVFQNWSDPKKYYVECI